MIVVGWPLIFYGKVKFASQCICITKMLESLFLKKKKKKKKKKEKKKQKKKNKQKNKKKKNKKTLKTTGWNLQCMIKVEKTF